ncbi:DUF6884 domain-containing protein [Streptomyces sp. NPDC004111]|uniref:DUF6884 domain-containing protein n=1 Tax=Streptomyces sp. NPDC004111 TaxID=3364690 RepID=UPI00368E24E5
MSSSHLLFVSPCGKEQRPGMHEPADLYTGRLFELRRKAIKSLRTINRGPAFILSTRHGLIEPRGTKYAMYDAADRETSVERVQAQAAAQGMLDAQVIAVASIGDIAFLREVFGHDQVVDMCREVIPDVRAGGAAVKPLAMAKYIADNPGRCSTYIKKPSPT